MGSFKRITLKDIARETGVSHVTVSLALRHHSSIPASTRGRIEAAAAQLGYRPDPVLAALNTYRIANQSTHYQANLGWIEIGPEGTPGMSEKTDTEYYRFWCGARDRASELGYKLEVFKLPDPRTGARALSRLLDRRRIQGLLLAPLPPGVETPDLDWNLFSTVAMGFSHRPIFNLICSSQHRNAREAARKLRERGYKSLGLLTWEDIDWRTDFNFSAGFWAEQTSAKLKPHILDLPEHPHVKRHGTLIRRWLEKNKIDAVVTPYIPLTLPVLGKLGFRIPEDIALATFSYLPQFPEQAGIDQLPEVSGKAAVNLLAGLLHRNERGLPSPPLRVFIDGCWADGALVPDRAPLSGVSK